MTESDPKPSDPTCGRCDDGYRLIVHNGTQELHRMPCACTHRPLPVTFVYQLDEGASCGCMIAAVSMATGVPYKTVRSRVSMAVDFTAEGFGFDDCLDVMDALGFSYQSRYRHSQRLGVNVKQEWPCKPWADRHLVSVRNLSDTGAHGVVLLRDGRVLDPWWGVIQGLHRYPEVYQMAAVYPVPVPA